VRIILRNVAKLQACYRVNYLVSILLGNRTGTMGILGMLQSIWAVLCGSSRLASHKIYEPRCKSLSKRLPSLWVTFTFYLNLGIPGLQAPDWVMSWCMHARMGRRMIVRWTTRTMRR